jgi:hypothetical protein
MLILFIFADEGTTLLSQAFRKCLDDQKFIRKSTKLVSLSNPIRFRRR